MGCWSGQLRGLLISFCSFGVHEVNNRCPTGWTMRQYTNQEWFYRWRPLKFCVRECLWPKNQKRTWWEWPKGPTSSSGPCPHTGSLKPDYELDLPSKIFSYKLDTCLLGLLSTSSSDSLYRISGYVTEEQDLWRCSDTPDSEDPHLILKPSSFWVKLKTESTVSPGYSRSCWLKLLLNNIFQSNLLLVYATCCCLPLFSPASGLTQWKLVI